MDKLFTGPYIILAYLVGAAAIFCGLYQNDVVLVACLLILLVWDFLYYCNPESFKGRSVTGTNESVTRARTYISWFIGLYGVIIGIVLSSGDEAGLLASALENSATPIWLFALPLVLSIVAMLFIPLQVSGLSEEQQQIPNTALKLLFFLVVYLQKIVLILIGNIGLRILAGWG